MFFGRAFRDSKKDSERDLGKGRFRRLFVFFKNMQKRRLLIEGEKAINRGFKWEKRFIVESNLSTEYCLEVHNDDS